MEKDIIKKEFNLIVPRNKIGDHYKNVKPLPKPMCLLLHGKRGSLNGQ